jgi:hypothetical protein
MLVVMITVLYYRADLHSRSLLRAAALSIARIRRFHQPAGDALSPLNSTFLPSSQPSPSSCMHEVISTPLRKNTSAHQPNQPNQPSRHTKYIPTSTNHPVAVTLLVWRVQHWNFGLAFSKGGYLFLCNTFITHHTHPQTPLYIRTTTTRPTFNKDSTTETLSRPVGVPHAPTP